MRGKVNWQVIIGFVVLLCAAGIPLALELLDRLQPAAPLNLMAPPPR